MESIKWMETLHPESPIREYLRWMSRSGNEDLYRERYEPIVRAQEGQKKWFLSVVMRTQGRRMDMLQDALTCLQAQGDEDFEVVIICHRAEEAAWKAVEALVCRQAPAFAERVRVFHSETGERGAPLNLGFAYARGEYAVCLDDDDLVLDHWVSSFHEAAREHDGMILHSWALTQAWQAETDGMGRQSLRSTGTPDAKYCVPYRTIDQQSENHCPFMGLAFPLFLFRTAHVLFNEELTTTEDWDYLLRTAGIAGVWDINEPTAIYRIWNTKDASRNLIREPEWKDNYRRIGQQMQDKPLILTSAEATASREELMGLQSAGQKGRSCFIREAVMFWSDERPFSDARWMAAPVQMKDGWIRAQFHLGERCGGERVTRFRIDPAEETMFALDHIRVRCMDGETTLLEMTGNDIRETNGLIDGDKLLFLAEDPRIIWESQEPIPPCTVVFTARVSFQAPERLAIWAEDLCADARWLAQNRETAHLYMDRGEGFRPEESAACGEVFRKEGYRAEFDLPESMAEGIRELRFDPTEAEMLWLDQLEIHLSYADGGDTGLKARDVRWMNGFESGEGLAFIERDPYMMIAVEPGRALRRVTVTGQAAFVRAEKMEDLFAQAVRVPDYELIVGQLHSMRQQQMKREGTNEP